MKSTTDSVDRRKLIMWWRNQRERVSQRFVSYPSAFQSLRAAKFHQTLRERGTVALVADAPVVGLQESTAPRGFGSERAAHDQVAFEPNVRAKSSESITIRESYRDDSAGKDSRTGRREVQDLERSGVDQSRLIQACDRGQGRDWTV